MTEPLLTVIEAASRLAVSPNTLYGWIASGQIAFCDLSAALKNRERKRVLRIPESEVTRMLDVSIVPARKNLGGVS